MADNKAIHKFKAGDVFDERYTGHYDAGTLATAGTSVYTNLTDNLKYDDAYMLKVVEACVAMGYTKDSNKKATIKIGEKSLSITFLSARFVVMWRVL